MASATAVGGGDWALAAEVFRRYDKDGSGELDKEELMAALRELGLLHKVSASSAGRVLAEMDLNGDGRVSFIEFREAFSRLTKLRAEEQRVGRIQRAPPAVPPAAATDPRLQKAFLHFASWGAARGLAEKVDARSSGLNSRQFQRACASAQLGIEQAAADVVFTNARKGGRLLSFPRFLEALALVSMEAGQPLEVLLDAVRACAPGTAGSPAKEVESKLPLSARASRRPKSPGACVPAPPQPDAVSAAMQVSEEPWAAPGPSLPPQPTTAPLSKLQQSVVVLEQLLLEASPDEPGIPAHPGLPSAPAGTAGPQQGEPAAAAGSKKHSLLNPMFQGSDSTELGAFRLELLATVDKRCEAAELRCSALVATRAEMTRVLVQQLSAAAAAGGASCGAAQQEVQAAIQGYQAQLAGLDSKVTGAVQQVTQECRAAVAALEGKLERVKKTHDEALQRVNEALLCIARRVGTLAAQ